MSISWLLRRPRAVQILPHSQDQLAAEITRIYKGLVMADAKFINLAAALAEEVKGIYGGFVIVEARYDSILLARHPIWSPSINQGIS